jgi:nucleoside-diphosphate-sugar epimerase
MSSIAITGASGFVGRALVARLRENGIGVTPVSRSNGSSNDAYETFPVGGDYSDISLLVNYFRGCDSIIHLAARAHFMARDSDCSTLMHFREANVQSLIHVAKAARIAGVQRLVFVSSIGVNGSATSGSPFTEVDEPNPTEPYALTKLEAERALSVQLASGFTDWVVLRPPLVYGPGCPGNLQKMIRLAAVAPILPFGAVRARRSLISIDNLLDALLIAARHPAVSRRTFVVSDDQDIDVASMLEAFLMGLGRGSWRLIPVPQFLIGLTLHLLGKQELWKKFSGELLIDSSAFRQATGWVPVVSPRVGLRMAAQASLSS